MLEIVDCVLAPLEMLSKKKGGKKKKEKEKIKTVMHLFLKRSGLWRAIPDE